MYPIYVETRPRLGAAVLPQSIPAPQPIPQAFAGPQPIPQALSAVSSNGLEIMVAPIALYPDAILRDLFPASTHPLEIIQANQWVHQNRDAAGSLPPNGYVATWDSSVRALTAYPDLLQRLGADVGWVTKLGVTYVAQPAEVMSAIQRLRLQAKSFRTPAGLTAIAR